MSIRPGPNVQTLTSVPRNSSPTNTGTWFVAGTTGQGPETPRLLTNFAQYQALYGTRGQTAYAGRVFDSVEQYFVEGGSRLYLSRANGATAVAAKLELESESAGGKCLIVKAIGKGTWAETTATKIEVAVVIVKAAAEFTIEVKYAGKQVEISPILTSAAEAVVWAKNSNYIVLSLGAKQLLFPETLAAKALSGGKEPTNAELGEAVTYDAAVKLFIPEYGPGQLSVPGGVGGAEAKAEHEALIKKV